MEKITTKEFYVGLYAKFEPQLERDVCNAPKELENGLATSAPFFVCINDEGCYFSLFGVAYEFVFVIARL